MFLTHLGTSAVSLAGAASIRLDTSIEGLNSQQFSVGVFFFMLLSVLVFTAIIYAVTFGKNSKKKLKPGEMFMVGAIMLGVVFAVIFGGLQLLSGDLF